MARLRCCRPTHPEPSIPYRGRRRPLQNPAGTGESLAEHAARNPDSAVADAGALSLQFAFADRKSQRGEPGLARTDLLLELRLPPARTIAGHESLGSRCGHLQRSHDAARVVAPVVRRPGFMGQLSRAVAAGSAGELLLAAAAGADAARRCSAHAGKLSPDPGQPITGRAAPGGSWPGDAGQPACLLRTFPTDTRSLPMAAAHG